MRRILRALRIWPRAQRACAPRHHKPRIEFLEERLNPSTFQSVIGLGAVQSAYPYRGAGYTVAVLDTGIDYNDADLGGGIGPGHRVVAGYNFVNNTPDPMDDNGHGTNVAGIIGSSNPSDPGVDPDVNFVALKVLDSNMNGSWTAIEDALNWVITNKTTYNIVAVNLSFGSGNYTSNPTNLLESDFATLKNMGVFTAVASGNQYYTFGSQQGLAYPATSPNVVSVGATWAGSAAPVTFSTGASESNPTVDHIVSFTQRSSALSVLAPGAWITSDGLDGGTSTYGGTSQATAVISGAAVLLHEAYDETGQSNLATQSNILALMQSTGVTIVDANYGTDNVTNTGLSFKRLNLSAAVNAIGAPIAPPTFPAIANRTMPVSGTIVVPLAASSPGGSPITYTAHEQYLPATAFQLRQQYSLCYLGNYYLNAYGQNEKWMSGAGGVWYGIFPDGSVRRWAGSITATLLPANLVGTLNPSYYADPSTLWNAPYAGAAPAVFTVTGTQLTIWAPAPWLGTFTVVVTASDGRYTVTQNFNVTEAANTPPVLAPITNVTIAHNQNAVVTLAGTDANGNALTYSATVLPVNGSAPALQATIAGTQLTLHATQPLVGTFTISAIVSDGMATATRTFTVTLTNVAPTLAASATQTLGAGQTSLTLTLPAADANNDTLTFQAVAQTPNAAAYLLNQQFGFRPANATYYHNLMGGNEKWLIGRNNVWYALLPNGKVYRYAGTLAQTVSAANLVATLDPSIYTEPRLLWNAAPPTTPALTFTFVGNQLTIHRPASLTGIFFVNVTVSDGLQTATRTMEVILN